MYLFVFVFTSLSLSFNFSPPLLSIATVVLNTLDSLTLILTLPKQKELSLGTQQLYYIFTGFT